MPQHFNLREQGLTFVALGNILRPQHINMMEQGLNELLLSLLLLLLRGWAGRGMGGGRGLNIFSCDS